MSEAEGRDCFQRIFHDLRAGSFGVSSYDEVHRVRAFTNSLRGLEADVRSDAVVAQENPFLKRFAKSLLVPALVLAAYAIACRLNLANSYLMPRPSAILAAFAETAAKGSLQRSLLVSLARVFSGFLIAAGTALPLALLFHFRPTMAAYFRGSLNFLRCTPPLALIPVLILWFGIGEGSKLAIIILTSFFPIFLNALSALDHVDPKLLEMGRNLELTKSEATLGILLPEAAPTIFTGLRLGFGYSWRALIGAEMIAASAGLGYMILDAEELARTDIMVVGILVIGFTGLFLDAASLALARRFFPWVEEGVQ
jgi:sulfonate transport system permease protein